MLHVSLIRELLYWDVLTPSKHSEMKQIVLKNLKYDGAEVFLGLNDLTDKSQIHSHGLRYIDI